MEPTTQPEKDLPYKTEWGELYILTRHWQSDLEFYKDELRFLHRLIDKYAMWLINDENISLVQAIVKRLTDVSRNQKNIAERITTHLRHLEGLMEHPFARNEQDFREEHVQLENEMVQFIKAFRAMKKAVFAITEHVIEEEKLKRMLTS